MRKLLLSLVLVAGLFLGIDDVVGQQAARTTPAGQAAKAQSGGKAATQVAPRAAAKASVPALKLMPAKIVDESALEYIPDNVLFVAAAQPARVLNAKAFRDMIKGAEADDLLTDLFADGLSNMGLDVSQVEEAAIFLDAKSLTELREQQKKMMESILQRNAMKQVGLAMHNYHDVYGNFPDDDGVDPYKGNLSWRVHILPFLEESALYQEFNLDEPWDSENNKALIARMPALFKTDGVDEQGKTSIHVLTGEGTPFGGDDAPRIQDILDGTTNTLMAVVGGTDTAEIWTKPGGLEVDPKNPTKALGNIKDRFLAGRMDGSVDFLSASIAPEEFQHLAQHQDGVTLRNLDSESGPAFGATPGMIVRSLIPIDQQKIVSTMGVNVDTKPQTVAVGNLKALKIPNGTLVLFPNPQTMLIGSEDLLKTMLAGKKESGDVKARFQKLYPASDLAAVVELESVSEELVQMMQGSPFPGMVQNLTMASAIIDATGSNEALIHIDVVTADAKSAQQISAVLNGGYQLMKGQLLGAASSEGSGLSDEIIETLGELMDSVTIEVDDSSVVLDMPKPEDAAGLMLEMTPAAKELFSGIRQSRARADEYRKLNSLRQLGLAMHNYHDIYNGFPSYNTPRSEGGNQGLSWRVYLLPLIGEGELYEKFHLDEPWDSDHNKTLIAQMPEIFESDNVSEPGKTSIHVFLGDDAPFGSDTPRGLRNITDGSSNTIMLVKAGSDTADIWTKPSGLAYDAEDPIKCLGQIGEKFSVLFCDGSVLSLPGDIDSETLLRLIEHADGQVVNLDF